MMYEAPRRIRTHAHARAHTHTQRERERETDPTPWYFKEYIVPLMLNINFKELGIIK